MHGFIFSYSAQSTLPDLKYQWKEAFAFQSPLTLRSIRSKQLQLEQYTSQKFLDEKLWIDTEDLLMVSDGVISNLKALMKAYKAVDTTELIRLMRNASPTFFEHFHGSFVGLLFDKQSGQVVAFNNHTGTKKLFYYWDKAVLICSTDLYTLSQAMASMNIERHWDEEASWLLLSSGFMHDDYTLLRDVKQVSAGSYLQLNNTSLTINDYFNLKDIIPNQDSKEVILDRLDQLFDEALKEEYELDRRNGLVGISTLSGGLDSRMVALRSMELGYEEQEWLNFSEPGYADEVIARDIARAFKKDLRQLPLTARGLMNIDQVVAVNDGLTLYSGAGHAFEALGQLDMSRTGFVHSGMIGDAVMGSFLSGKEVGAARISDGLYSASLLDRARPVLEASIAKYRDEEMYKFYNRAFLGANNGFQYFELAGACSSPFLHPPFLRYAQSIPRHYLFQHRLYIDWIQERHPRYADFVWEAMGGRPTNNNFLRQWYRWRKAVLKRLPLPGMWRKGMNPEQEWYDKHPEVKACLDNYFEEKIATFAGSLLLRDELSMLYSKGNITEKTQVLTLLAAWHLLMQEKRQESLH